MEITPEQLKVIIKEAITEAQIKEQKLTLTLDEANELSGIGKNKIMELAHSKNSDFPAFRNGAKFLINREMLINWLEKVASEKRVI